MSIRRTSLVVALLAFFVGGSVALAEPLFKNKSQSTSDPSEELLTQNPERRMGQKRKDKGRILQELNLSDQQKQQLEEIKQKYQGQIQPLRENMKSFHKDLQTLMAGTASTNEIRAKHQQLDGLRQQMGNLRFESMLEMREILTPEQRSKFAQLMEQRRDSFRQRLTDPSDSDE